MFELNKLLNQAWFEMRFMLMLFGTVMMMAATFFHGVHFSDQLASKNNVEKVYCLTVELILS